MNDALALLVAGVGLSFLGLELVTNALQETSSRTLRALIKRSTRSRPACALIGIAAGALVQSASAVAAILGGMTSTGLTTLSQAIPIVAFANVGPTALVFAGAIDIHVAVLLAIGISAIAFSLATEFHWKAAASVLLGVALVLYGSDLMSAAAGDVQGAGWFAAFLRRWHDSSAMAFALGCLASFLTQSTTLVALTTIIIASAGLVAGPSALAMLYGANLGSTLMRMLLTTRSSGTQLEIIRFQDLFKIAGAVVFMLWFVAEQAFGVPGMYLAITHLPTSLPIALATANLAFNGSMALVATLMAGPIERLVSRLWPPDRGEDLGTPLYALPDLAADAATAIDLLEREQMRMLQGTREYITLVRNASAAVERGAITALHRRFGRLFNEVEHFHVTLVSREIDEATSARVGNVHGRQKVVELLEDSLFQFASALEKPWQGSALEPLVENLVETTDFLLMFAGDAARTLEKDRAELLFNLSSDRSEMMISIRALYLAPERSLGTVDRTLLLRLTALFERIVWMVQRYSELLLRNLPEENAVRIENGELGIGN